MRRQKNQTDDSPAERAVNRFHEAQRDLDNFLHLPEVREIMTELARLVEDYNATLDAAGRSVKQQLLMSERNKLVVGDFGAQKKVSRWYDGEFLADHLSVNQSELVLEEITTYRVKVDVLDQLARQGEVDNEVVRLAFHEDAPTASMMPGAPKPYNIPTLREEDEWQEPQSPEDLPPQSVAGEKSNTKTSRRKGR